MAATTPSTTPKSQLRPPEIPHEAVRSAFSAHVAGLVNVQDMLTAAAPHIVAAELRRMAAEETAEYENLRKTLALYDKGADGIYKAPASTYDQISRLAAIRIRLLRRADELDGGVR